MKIAAVFVASLLLVLNASNVDANLPPPPLCPDNKAKCPKDFPDPFCYPNYTPVDVLTQNCTCIGKSCAGKGAVRALRRPQCNKEKKTCIIPLCKPGEVVHVRFKSFTACGCSSLICVSDPKVCPDFKKSECAPITCPLGPIDNGACACNTCFTY